MIETRRAAGTNTTLLFIDFRSAYDRLDRRVLIRLLRDKGILREDQIQLLEFLLNECTTSFGNYETRVTNGVPQGSTLAPILFDIFVEALTEELTSNGIEHQFYADDLLIIGDDATVVRAMEIIEGWSAANNMEVNRRKSGILVINGSGFRTGTEVRGYPVVSSYKYLGLRVNGRLDLEDHLR